MELRTSEERWRTGAGIRDPRAAAPRNRPGHRLAPALAVLELRLREKIKEGGGMAELKTVEGEPLTVKENGGKLWLIDAKGDMAQITIGNVMQSNGVIQVINTVLLPG